MYDNQEFDHEDELPSGIPARGTLSSISPTYFRRSRNWIGAINHSPKHHLDPNERAFGNDLQLGRVVIGRLQGIVADYVKGDTRPLLVTGLWRRGEDIEKIEVMRYTSSRSHAIHPDRFRLDTFDLIEDMKSPQGGILKTADTIILDNIEQIFPSSFNDDDGSIASVRWPEVLVRRAYSLMYHRQRETTGYDVQSFEGLTREGFFFPKMPQSAIYSDAFAPEVMVQGKSSGILPQKLVDMIGYYALCYTEEKNRYNKHTFFEFPPMSQWRTDIAPAEYPDWTEGGKKHGRVSNKMNGASDPFVRSFG